MRKVIVTDYQSEWKEQFEKEQKRLYKAFGNLVLTIHHIGSTSVEGMKAKPIIDILPVVYRIDDADLVQAELRKLGYEAKGENGIKGRRFFQKGGEERTHHLHVFEKGHPDIKRHLAFRDYLRQVEEARGAYSMVKERLAKKHPFDIEAYIKGKDKLIQEIEQKALKWAHP